MTTRLQADADRRAERLRAAIAAELGRLREDAGLTRAAVARAAGVHHSVIARVEDGDILPTLETYCRLCAALGADFAARPYPNTGPPIHDRHAVRMSDALLRGRHRRWRVEPEVVVRTPARGVIDAVLHDVRAASLVASELVSDVRRVEQVIRWSREKAESLPSASQWPDWVREGTPTLSRLLVVRRTRANRDAVTAARRLFREAYPADPRDAFDALTGPTAPWPGAALLWVREAGGVAELSPD